MIKKKNISNKLLKGTKIIDGDGLPLLVYQGTSTDFDNRDFNYFTLNEAEAKNYGGKVRAVHLNIKKPLEKNSDIFWTLKKYFNKKTGKEFDILLNSKEGLKTQAEFFKFLKGKGYDGLTYLHEDGKFSPSSDNQYVVSFNTKQIIPADADSRDKDIEVCNNLYKDHHEVWEKLDVIEKEICDTTCDKFSREIVLMWNTELKKHFSEEEKDLFPSLVKGNKKVIENLIQEHKQILSLINKIKKKNNASDILAFCKLMKSHIKKEEQLMVKVAADPYKEGGKVELLAPNGKPSNLSSEQYKLVRTPEFKDWFGDWQNDPENASKVIDSNGEPLIMYHGSLYDFTEFKEEKIRIEDYDAPFNGFWFSSNKRTSPAMVDPLKIYSVFLNIRNLAPSRIWKKVSEEIADIGMEKNPYRSYGDATRHALKRDGFDGIAWEFPPIIDKNKFDIEGKFEFMTARGSKYWIEKDDEYGGVDLYNDYHGYITGYLSIDDLVNSYDTIYVAFSANQIKLADGSNTTFDTNNPDIRFELGGSVKNDKLKILYLHGLHATLKSDHAKILNDRGVTIIAPHLKYEEKPMFEHISSIIKSENINAIVGHSMGGRLAYYLSNKYQIPCLMFNPAFDSEGENSQPVPSDVKRLKPYYNQMAVVGSEDEDVPTEQQIKFLEKTKCKIFIEKIDHAIPDNIKIKYFKKFINNINVKINDNAIVSFSDFHLDTIANFKKIEEKQLPHRKPDFISDSGSKYWYDGEYVFRQADHWGEMDVCDWLLNGSSHEGMTQGVCALSDFKRKNKFKDGGSINSESGFEIIPNEQTPKTEKIKDVKKFIKENFEELKKFLSFSESLSAEALAANQVSVNGKRVMWRVFALKGFNWKLIINPTIDEHIGEKELKHEGCLSFKCKKINALRSPKIKVSYYTFDGNKVEGEIISGYDAQVWQHEIEHLDGIKKDVKEMSGAGKFVCENITGFKDGGQLEESKIMDKILEGTPDINDLSEIEKKQINALLGYDYWSNPEEEDESLPNEAPDWIIKASGEYLKARGITKLYRGISKSSYSGMDAYSWTYDKIVAEFFGDKILEKDVPENVISMEVVFAWVQKNGYYPKDAESDFIEYIDDFEGGESEVIIAKSDNFKKGGEIFKSDVLNQLSSTKNFVELKKIADENYKKIASGTSRVVYYFSDDYVLKVAKNKKGIEQNKTESNPEILKKYGDVVAKVINYDKDGRWELQEFAKGITEQKFEELMPEYQFDGFAYYLRGFGGSSEWYNKLHFAKRIKSLIKEFGLEHYDIANLSSWGIVNGKVVLVDYGLSLETARKLYGIQYNDGGMIIKNDEQLITVEPALQNILKILSDKGHQSLIVGGAVRDAVLGIEPKDIDIEVYKINYNTLSELLSQYGKVDLVGKTFGVIKFKPRNARMEYDFSVPRKENKIGIGHKEFEVVFDEKMTIREAAERRDVTANSLAYDPLINTIYDYFGGLEDIKNKILRHTSDKFKEDPLRIMRLMQFQARFDFTIHPSTIIEIKEILKTKEFESLPKERIFEEWKKWAEKGVKHDGIFKFMRETGLIEYYPMLKALKDTPQDKIYHPEGDVEIHTSQCLAYMDKILSRENITGDEKVILVMGIMLHDIGKPDTTKEEMKRGRLTITSNGHEPLGGIMAKEFLANIGFHESLIEPISNLVTNHLAGVSLIAIPNEKGKIKNVKKLSRRLAPANINQLLFIMEADHNGRGSDVYKEPTGGKELAEIAKDLKVEEKPYEYILMGRHLIEAGLKPSPKFGEILAKSYEAQENGEFDNLEGAKKWLNENLSTFKDGGELLVEAVNILLAPNGKPSNLNEVQYNLVRSPEFIAWFGDFINSPETASKVVDENGEPAVVFHGTDKEFNVFDINNIGKKTGNYGHYGYGYYFSFDKMESEHYGKKIIEVFCNFKNPFIPTDDNVYKLKENGVYWIPDYIDLSIDFDSLYSELKSKDEVAAYLLKSIIENGYEKGWDVFLKTHTVRDSIYDLNDVTDLSEYVINKSRGIPEYIYELLQNGFKLDISKIKFNRGFSISTPFHYITELGSRSKEVTDVIIKLGYDGVIAGSELVVFNSNQIKLADGTNTTFDDSNPDIRFDDGGEIESTTKALEKLSKKELGLVGWFYPTQEIEIPIKDIIGNHSGQTIEDAIQNVKDGNGGFSEGNIFVYQEGDKYDVQDGMHRIAKAIIAGRETIMANVKMTEAKDIAEAYHKALVDGSNPKLVKAVEEAIGKTADVSNAIFDNGGEAADFENSEKNSNFTNNKTIKDELQSIISGDGKVRNGEAIQTALLYLRREEGTSPSGEKSKSDLEEEKLIEFINDNNLWYTKQLDKGNYIDRGMEQSVYEDTDSPNFVLKTNNAIFYDFYWSKYFVNLLLHNYFFPATSYELVGFKRSEKGSLMSVVRQPFIEKNKPTDLKDVEKFLLNKGFIRFHPLFNMYTNKEAGVTLSDFHDGNVLTKDDVLYFIDGTFFNETFSDGGKIKNKFDENKKNDRLHNVISGNGKTGQRAISQTTSSNIRRSESAVSVDKGTKLDKNQEGNEIDGKGKFELPENHQPFLKVPKGGSSCANCKWLTDDKKSCSNKYFIQWYGKSELPQPLDEHCSDWWTPVKDEKYLYGGKVPFTELESDLGYSFKKNMNELYNIYLLKPKHKNYITLGELISHEKLFAKHPEFKKIIVIFDDITNEDVDADSDIDFEGAGIINAKIKIGLHFTFFKNNGHEKFELNTTSNPEYSKEGVLLHEMQHVLQLKNRRSFGYSYDRAIEAIRGQYPKGHGEGQEENVYWRNEEELQEIATLLYKSQIQEQEAMFAVDHWLQSIGLEYGDKKYFRYDKFNPSTQYDSQEGIYKEGGKIKEPTAKQIEQAVKDFKKVTSVLPPNEPSSVNAYVVYSNKNLKMESGGEIQSEIVSVEIVSDNGEKNHFDVNKHLILDEVLKLAKEKALPYNLKSFQFNGVKYIIESDKKMKDVYIPEDLIEEGTKIEMEHKDTIKKVKENPSLSIKDVARLIAIDHLKESLRYYKKLLQMEKTMQEGGKIRNWNY